MTAKGSTGAVPKEATRPANEGLTPPRRPTLTLLIVDDSRLHRRMLASSLSGSEYRVIEAGSAEEALILCRTDPPDIILSDWMMPGLSGLDLCARVRSFGDDRYIYFIVLTAKRGKDEIAMALQSGADDFLTKPVSPDELLARLHAAARVVRIERELVLRSREACRAASDLQRLDDALNRDLAEARKLQLSLVPRGSARLAGGSVSYLLQPSGPVGGDLVGGFPISDTRHGVFSLDISGHGVASALVAARVSGWLTGGDPGKNVALERRGGRVVMRRPDMVCARLNRMFLSEFQTDHYATVILAEVDFDSGRVDLCQAGHPHPILVRADGRQDSAGQGGMPVGLIEDAAFETVSVSLFPGDRLLIHSDGVTECPDPGGGLLGEDGLARLVARHWRAPGRGLLKALRGELAAMLEGSDPPDDVSMAVIDRAPA
ncbi:PP2C family protein-serine/threonine phosphatase [Palleronia salina]|uniref:PP2C family protein-serine/threonine phosphatase n=1 Tax=Palleronia salina TaxID=313368 RepID=UPI00357159F3